MLVKTLKRIGLGFLIGVVVGDLIAMMTGSPTLDGLNFASKQLLDMSGGNQILAILLQSLFSGLYGSLCFAGMSFYEIERWSLALATAAHCALIVLSFIPVALLLGWFSDILSLLIMSCMQLVGFFIIWLILYSVYKKQVRELNEIMTKQSEKKE